ncbi:SET and MYND domain-containing protein 4 [Linnemannia zychae]|nr:SET and MYND domain-containing protein 4 [Linnemannia zychae]
MATQLQDARYNQLHNQVHSHHRHHSDPKTPQYRERLLHAANKTKTSDDIIGEPVAACFGEDLVQLLTSPTLSYSAIQKAFNDKPCLKSRKRIWTLPAGLDPLPKLLPGGNGSGGATSTLYTGTTTLAHIRQGSELHEGTQLDSHFRINFSTAFGQLIELNLENQTVKEGHLVDSGTYVFASDELPYASVMEKEWRGKRCEECFRELPTAKDEQEEEQQQQQQQENEQGARGHFRTHECTSCPHLTDDSDYSLDPIKFCSRECLQSAWRTWHGYECKFMEELDQLEQDTRLALRIFWKTCLENIQLVNMTDSSETGSVDALANATTELSINSHNNVDSANRAPRVQSKDGTHISIRDLYHNFEKLPLRTQTTFLLKAYYLQELLGLSKNAAQELAQIQALVKFNCFAIKSKEHPSTEQSRDISTMINYNNEHVLGSGIYLLGSMFNHSCTPNALAVFGQQSKASLRSDQASADSHGAQRSIDPRLFNVLTSKSLMATGNVSTQVEISYGPMGGRMATEERKECLRQKYLFECNCSACNDKYAESLRKRVFKCQKKGYACKPLLEEEEECPTCGEKVDMNTRQKMMTLVAQLLGDSSNPTLPPSKRLTLLKTLELTQRRLFVDTYMIYGHTCDQLAMVYTQLGDLGQAIPWCRKALKVVMVHFPHDSIEVAQETVKLAGLLFNNHQHKEALKHVQTAITLYRGHYGAESKEPDLIELYQMEQVLKPIVEGMLEK